MKHRSVTRAVWLAMVVSGNSVAGPSLDHIWTSPDGTEVYFRQPKSSDRTKLDQKSLSAWLLFLTKNSRTVYMGVVGDSYCSGSPDRLGLVNSKTYETTRSSQIRRTDQARNIDHAIADALCKDYGGGKWPALAAELASTENRPGQSATFSPFTDQAIFEATLMTGGGTARASYRGSGSVDGEDILAKVTGTNQRSAQTTTLTFKVPKVMCETGTGQALVSDGHRGWTDAITLKDRKPVRYYATNDLTLGIIDGVCQRSGNISLLKPGSVATGSSSSANAQHSPAGSASKTQPITAGDLTKCTREWIEAFNEERGEEGPIPVDQLDEWKQWCKQGKRPG